MVQHMMKTIGGSANSSCSHTFCVSTSGILQVEGPNKETANSGNRNLLKTKQKKNNTIDNAIEKHMLSNSTGSFQETTFSVSPGRRDKIERSSAVLDLVNFVDKFAVLVPNRLGESYSCTTSAILRQYELRKKRHRPSSNNNACAKHRYGSNYTMSKKRSCLLKTILNTKFTQSTPSHCTYNFKNSETKHSHEITNLTIVQSEQQPKKHSTRTKQRLNYNLQHKSDIAPKLKQVLRPNINCNLKEQSTNIDAPIKYQRAKVINEFCFSRLGSKSKDSLSGVISSDLTSKLYVSEPTKEFPLENPNNKIYHISDESKTYKDVNCENNLLIKSASSSLITMCSVNKTFNLHNYTTCYALETQVDKTKRKGHIDLENDNHFSKISRHYSRQAVSRRQNSWTTYKKKIPVAPCLADDLKSSFKIKNHINKYEIKCNFSLMRNELNNEKKTSYTSKEVGIRTTNINQKIKRRELLIKDNQLEKNKVDIDVVFPNRNNLSHADLNGTNVNEKPFVKDNLHISSESVSSIVVSIADIQRLLKNNQVKVIGPEGRRLRFKNVDSESLSNIKRKQLLEDDLKTPSKREETFIKKSNVTRSEEIPEQIRKETEGTSVQDNKLDLKFFTACKEIKRSNVFNSIAKYFYLFAKKKKPIQKELVHISTGVPSLSKCLASELQPTEIYYANKPCLFDSKTHIDDNARMKIKPSNLNTLHKNNWHQTKYSSRADKFSKSDLDTQNIATKTEDNQFANYLDVNARDISQKHGIKHKLKTYLSAFQLQKKYSNKFVQNTPTSKVDSLKFEEQNSVTMIATKTQNACSLAKYYESDTSDERNEFYHPGKELYRKATVLCNINQPLPPRYNIQMKKREQYYSRYEFEKSQLSSSLSDSQSYSCNIYDKSLIFNKYDFTEDELIYKAIRTAIKRQILKTSYSKFRKNKSKNNKKYYKQSQRQCSSNNSFSQRFYAMNVHRLKPYECAPGVCVPNIEECDPNVCIKLINKRLKKKASTTTTPGSKSISSQGAQRPKKQFQQEYYPPPHTQATRTYAPGRQSVPAGVTYTKPAYKPPQKKQAVRVGSSFSFNVEFSKGKSGAAVRPKIQKEHIPKEQVKRDKGEKKKKEKHMKTHKAAGQTEYKHKDSSTSTADPNKHGKLKRCLCTLKLQKQGNIGQPQLPKDGQADQIADVAPTQKRHVRRHLDPHECEPKVCIPGSCDPNECLKRIKYRDRGFNAEPIGHNTSSSATSPEKQKIKRIKEGRVQGKRNIAPREHHKSEIAPNKQAVKIGSTFSFSLEFYKNLAPPVVEIEPDQKAILKTITPVRTEPPQKIKGRKVGGPRSSATSMITEYGVDRGSEFGPGRRRKRGDVYGLHDRGVESRLGPRSESRGTGTLRRCFCTLKLHKQGKVPAGQVKLVKHHGTASGKYKEEPDFYSKGANTRKLLPYECEPGICIPGECDPYECDKRIQARFCRETGTTTGKKGRYPTSHSTATVYKHAQQGTKGPRQYRSSRGQGMHPDYRDVAQSIQTVVEEPRYRPILRKTRQVVRLGSDFKFNIEFFKDKTEHKTECIPPKPRGRGKSWYDDSRQTQASVGKALRSTRQSYFKRSHPSKAPPPGKSKVICECPVEKPPAISKSRVSQAEKSEKRTGKSQLKPKRHPAGTSHAKNHGSTMTALKRCFCTLSLKNKGQTQTVYTTVLNKCDDPFHYIENRSITNAITGRDDEKSYSTTKMHQCCNETENLLQEIFEQSQLPSLYHKHSVTKINKNDLPYVKSQVFFENYLLSRDKWSSVTGFLPLCKKSIYAMRVDANTCGPKTCKAKPCNLASCTKKAKNKQEDTKTLNNTKSTAVKQLYVTNKKAKISKNQIEDARKRNDYEQLKGKNNGNRFLSAQRTTLTSKRTKEYYGKSKVVDESRFKSINDPFRQAVHITSSFTLNLEFRRDKLPDALKLPYDDVPEQKFRTGISVQTRRQKPQATEKSIGVGSKLRKYDMNVIEMKNKNISCDLPFEPSTLDAGVGTKHKYKAVPVGCDPMCDPDYCTCSTRKESKAPRRRSRLHKRESVQIGSKISCNIEFFRDHTYSLGPYRKGAGQNSNNNKQSKQPVVNIIKEAPRSQRNDDTGNRPHSQIRSPSVKTKESGVGPALKRCFCTLTFQKQIVNYLSIDTKSPLKLKHSKITGSNRCHSKHRTENRFNKLLCMDTIIKSHSKQQMNEMETIFPYIPNKFNKTNRALIKKEENKHTFYKKDYTKRQKRNNRRQHKYVKKQETCNNSQNIFLGFKKIFYAQSLFHSFKQIFKMPLQNTDNPVNLSNKSRKRQAHKKSTKVPSIGIIKVSRSACRSRKQHKNTRKTLKVSKSDRRPIKSKITKCPKKSESSRPTILEIRKKKGPSEQRSKKYSHHQCGDADEYLKKIKNHYNLNSHYGTISGNLKTKMDSKLNPFMDNKLVYVSLVNRRTSMKNKPDTQILNDEAHQALPQSQEIQQYQGQEPRHEQSQLYKKEPKIKEVKPLFDIHLKAADMSLLNTDDIYDKVMQLKRNRNKDHRKSLKIMRQLHGEMCCCCVCKALRKQQKQEQLKTVKEDTQAATQKKSLRTHIQALKNKQKSCVCKSKVCEKEFQRKQLEKQLRSLSHGKDDVCVCGTKICKKEALKQTLKKKLSTKDRNKYNRLLESAKDEQKTEMRNIYLQEIAQEVKNDQERQKRDNKLAAKKIKKLQKTNNIVLCTDALIDLIKYTGLTVFGTVRGLVRAILNPKRIYYKLRYPHETLTLQQLQPSSLTALASRMGTRMAYSPQCKACKGSAESNRCIASMLTAIDGKKRKPKKEHPRTKLITTTNFGCSLFMSSLRKKPFLKVYFTCPWFYPHCINLIKLGRNIVEVLLFCLAVLVWSPCILCMELARGLMCCTMCTG